ncbi:hypothetical protein [Winogradskyella sp.]|uniref:hypothetical protein n=1 Tax=Winogradskyella sp. TaxID=1883156 RepID=UPI002608BB67|nr:hypothetical protein [Winogradskyella sp.]
MKRITYIRKIPIMKLIFGLALLIFSIILLKEDIKSLILCGIAVYFLLTEGTEFDFENDRYRPIKSILGINLGTWKPLPKIEYISVFRTNETTTVRARSAETNVTNEIIKLNLFYNTNRKIEAYSTKDIEDAFKKAHELAPLFNVDILDATERESKWL